MTQMNQRNYASCLGLLAVLAGGALVMALEKPAIATPAPSPDTAYPTEPAATDAGLPPSADPLLVTDVPSPEPAVGGAEEPLPTVQPEALADYLEASPSQSAQDLNAQTPQPSTTRASQALTAQAPDAVPPPLMQEPRESIDSFKFSIFNWNTEPTALQGALRRRVVATSIKTTGIAVLGSAVLALSDDTHVGLTVEAGESILAFDLGLISASENPRSGFGLNLFNQRSYLGTYRNGENEVDLPNGEDAWIHRLGLGAEYYLPFDDNFESAFGLTYQRVSVRDELFTSDVFAFDEEGSALTVDDDGIDDLLTLNFSAVLDNRVRPTPLLTVNGDILRFGVNQGFNLGEDSNSYTQFVGNYTRYIPLRLFAFDDGPRVLILNVQGGLGLGDVPSYEGFNLGGRNSVRGYSSGEVSTAASFFQATAEYRFPVAQFEFRDRPVLLRGALFADFATDFGTADEVVGEPAEVRDKPGDGFGFGVGLHTIAGSLFNRIELGISDEGDVDFIFTFGDRF